MAIIDNIMVISLRPSLGNTLFVELLFDCQPNTFKWPQTSHSHRVGMGERGTLLALERQDDLL